MARIYPLFSSSKGNSTYIGDEHSGILIDCGVSFKRLSGVLALNNIPLKAVQAVFITHEHSDHISGLKMLTKNTGIPVYGQKRTLQRLCDSDKIAPSSSVIDMSGTAIACADSEICCFNTPHDTIQSCGYRIRTGDDKLCAVCTDLGHITQEVDEALNGCRLVLLESNYDEGMILASDYPYYLKRRIRSDSGHLSNDDCSTALPSLAMSGTRHFILGHLSQNNNMGLLAHQAAAQALTQAGLVEQEDYTLQVARRSEPSIPVVI